MDVGGSTPSSPTSPPRGRPRGARDSPLSAIAHGLDARPYNRHMNNPLDVWPNAWKSLQQMIPGNSRHDEELHERISALEQQVGYSLFPIRLRDVCDGCGTRCAHPRNRRRRQHARQSRCCNDCARCTPGSSPVPVQNRVRRRLAKLVRPPPIHGGCRGFESLIAHFPATREPPSC